MRSCQAYFLNFILAAALLFGGCGKSGRETIPELTEPVAAGTSFRPVELRTIGNTRVLYGTVAPMEYCCFYDVPVNVKEIVVEVGDYVQKGDVLAYTDMDASKEALEDLSLQLEQLAQSNALNEQIARIQIEKIASEEVPVQDVSGNILPAEDVSANRIDAEATEELRAEKEKTLGVAQENFRYDALLGEYRIQKLQEALEEQKKIMEEGILIAPHSGYVLYAKNLQITTDALACENIVILADPEETYIELTDRTIDKYVTYKDDEVKYLQYAGDAYEVTELAYGVNTEVLAKVTEQYPNVRLYCPDAPKLVLGETYPIFYREKKTQEVPAIGLDSLKGEKDAYYVYVRTEDGGREKRFVTIGDRDDTYAQVLTGLSIGEMVYYESDSRMPTSYTEYTVELTDYRIENISRKYQMADEPVVWYDAEFAGTITEVLVKSGEEVEAGDLLYVMRSEAGKAALTEAQNHINQEKLTYAERIKQLEEEELKEKDDRVRRILALQKELETINHSYRLKQLEQEYQDMAENNNGSGEVRIYAKQSGTVTKLCVKKETKLRKGGHVLALGNKADDKLLVQMEEMKEERNYPANIAEFSERVLITVGDKEYQGSCIGITVHRDVNEDKYYVSESEGKSSISYCTNSGYAAPAFYVSVENESDYQKLLKGKISFSYVAMEDVVVVPTSMVYEEINERNPAKKNYFVWRVADGELIKQYVLVNKAFSDLNMTVILAGVEEKDVLAREK